MTPRCRLPRSEILRGYRAFASVFSERRYIDSEYIRCYFICRGKIPPGSFKVGFAVRNARKSVTRNYARRLLREACRLNKTSIVDLCRRHETDIQCVFLTDASRLNRFGDFLRIQKSVQEILQKLCQQIFPVQTS